MAGPLEVRGVAGHLAWAAEGSVWACYRVSPFGYPQRASADARDIHARTTAALLTLAHQSLVLSVARRMSKAELADRIAAGGDRRHGHGWAGQARRVAARAAAEPVWERAWFLAIRLADPALASRFRAAGSEVGGGFGLSYTPPRGSALVRAQMTSAKWEEQVSGHLDVARLTGAQVAWLFEQAALRGLAEPTYPTDIDRAMSVVRLDRDAVYYEGGRRDQPGRPRHYRYLTVDHPDHGTAHQTFLCLGETPPAWTFPFGSGEWLWHLDDQLPFPVDWAIRLDRIENDAARRRTLRAKRNLVGQLAEPGGDPAGPATSLSTAVDVVDEHRSKLEANPALPAFRATTIVAIANRDLAVMERRAAVLEATFRAAEHNFYRPTGSQLDCMAAMLPCSTPTPVVAEYAQDLLPDGLASAMPFAGSGVGDPTGMWLGRCLDTQYRQGVLLDPGRGPRDLNRSASLAAVGELGAGKSFLAKTLAWNTVAMGGQVVAVDRTEAGEYARLAPVVTGSGQVVEISENAEVCLDPFRVFDTDEARLRYGVGFLALLTATPPGSAAGTHLYRAAQTVLDDSRASGTEPRLIGVVEHLDRSGQAGDVGEKLEALAAISYGRLVFADPGSAVDLNADYVCFHIPGLRLPRRGSNRDDLLPEELIGQAILYLVAAFSQRVLFRHTDRFAALLLDEAHALTANPQGRALVADLIRDGRKHHAAVWLFTQLASDLTDEHNELEALLGYRAVFRQSPHTAEAALRFLGSDPRQANLETLTRLDTGACLLRDLEGRLGLVAVDPPDSPDVLAAFSTTPLHQISAQKWTSLNGHTDRHPEQATFGVTVTGEGS